IGIPALAAHMFVFYFGIIADVTPPVALAAFAGAGISGGNALRTGINASKLAIAAFIIPYMFVMSPELLLQGGDISITIMALVTAIIGMIALSASLIGYFVDYMKKPERLILFMGGLLMVNPGVTTDIIGIALIITVIFLQKRHKRKTL
ncbi:MAG: TRAP transporter large permease subunit, partial [Selenomonadaceae bacterium]|nr:TRAP transporter large permease subunit [Selenomonadaceae bacterium]